MGEDNHAVKVKNILIIQWQYLHGTTYHTFSSQVEFQNTTPVFER
jgi:hypothetical protein